MNIESNFNYCILSNNINHEFLKKFFEYPMIDDKLSFNDLKQKIEFNTSKMIVLNDTFYRLNYNEILIIIDLFKKQQMKFIYITSDIEKSLICDKIVVFNNDEIVLNGLKEDVLKEEKVLKRLGFGLPFVVDLSLQLNYYDVLNKIYFDMSSLIGDLWN